VKGDPRDVVDMVFFASENRCGILVLGTPKIKCRNILFPEPHGMNFVILAAFCSILFSWLTNNLSLETLETNS